MGRVQYGCCCKPCRDWGYQSQVRSRETREFNSRIIEALRAKPCPEAPVLVPEPTKVVLPPEAPVDEEALTRTLSAIRTPSKPKTNGRKTNGHKVANEPALIKPVEDEVKPPPTTKGVRDYIKDVATFEAITKAYYEPQIVSPAAEPGRERRIYEDMEIIVAQGGSYPVIWFKRREVATGPSQLLAEKPKAPPKAKGGRGGSQAPTDIRALLKALEASGCKIEKTGSGHIKVTRDGKTITLPSTASDWRSLKNSVAQARKDGLL
jgi:hypothetical protein